MANVVLDPDKDLTKYLEFAAFWTWYPDLVLDLMKPKVGGIQLHTDQRVFMRSASRFYSIHGCFNRAWGKTFCEFAVAFVTAIRYPNITIAISAQTKENASSMIKAKYLEFIKFYPIAENEVEKTNFSKTNATIFFKGGSTIDCLANSQSSKGQRRTRLSMEESNLMDNITFEDALEPVVEAGRITTGPLALNNPEELNQKIDFYTTPGFRGSDEYQRNLRMYRDMLDLTGDIVLGSDWRLACWYSRGSSKDKILDRMKKMSSVAFDMNYGGKWVGSATGALVSINRLMNCRTLTSPELEAVDDTSEYYIGVDVARSQKKSNNQSSIAVGKVVRNSSGKLINIELVNIIHMSNTLNFATQACIVKRTRKRYNAKNVIVDGNG